MGPQSHRSELDGVAQLATVVSACTPTVAHPNHTGEDGTSSAVEAIAKPMQISRAIDAPAATRSRIGTLATYVSRMGVGRVSKSSVHIILR
jgi:hypothetical protein